MTHGHPAGQRPIDVSIESRALSVVDPEFIAIDRGILFVYDNEQPVVLSGGVVETLIHVPVDPDLRGIRLGGVFSSTSAALMELFQGPTWSDVGTVVTEINQNRINPLSTVVTITEQPIITDDGERLIVRLLPGGRKGTTTAGASQIIRPQIIVPAGENVLVRMTNLSDRDQYVVLGLTWIELPDPFPDP